MKNCYVTQLKATVDNNSLKKLGTLVIKRVYIEDETADSAVMSILRSVIPEDTEVTLKIVGNGYFMDTYGGESIGKEVVLTKNSTARNLYSSNNDYDIEVSNKYYFKLSQASLGHKINTADTYYTLISSIAGKGYYGSFAGLNPENIMQISLQQNQLPLISYTDADIERLNKLTNITIPINSFPEIKMTTLGTLIDLTGTMTMACAAGSIEEFVAVQRANGRTSFSGTLNFQWIGASNKVYFNGSKVSNTQDGVLTWTASTITFRGTTITA